MKLSAADLPLLRWNLLVFSISIIVCVVVLYSSGLVYEKSQNYFNATQKSGNNARNQLIAAIEDQKNMAIYADEYGLLIKRKIIGDEQRLDWMEGLEKLRKKNLVTDFRYSIAPQINYSPQPPIDSGNFVIHYSEMKLDFDLLHEAQLIKFFAALNSNINGWYLLESCAVHRSTAVNPDEVNSTLLKAECSGGWITLKNRNAAS